METHTNCQGFLVELSCLAELFSFITSITEIKVIKPLKSFPNDHMSGSPLNMKEICKQTSKTPHFFQTMTPNNWMQQTNFNATYKAEVSKFEWNQKQP
jgi:hypothetical protein